MVRAIEQIEQDLQGLERAIVNLGSDLRSIYQDYLALLGQATRKQLIMACYYLCTQNFPDRFLALSVHQRQELQQAIRRLTQQCQEQLRQTIDQVVLDPPTEVAHWQTELEKALSEVFKNTSAAANRLLETAEILPTGIPEPILEAATRADVGSEAIAGPPNILKLVIEPPPLPEEELKKELTGEVSAALLRKIVPMKVVAIRLRLVEIEFAESEVSVWRTKIRGLMNRLNSLEQELRQKQQEHAIARAESAWRSIWFED